VIDNTHTGPFASTGTFAGWNFPDIGCMRNFGPEVDPATKKSCGAFAREGARRLRRQGLDAPKKMSEIRRLEART
jgi:hypothetical protein